MAVSLFAFGLSECDKIDLTDWVVVLWKPLKSWGLLLISSLVELYTFEHCTVDSKDYTLNPQLLKYGLLFIYTSPKTAIPDLKGTRGTQNASGAHEIVLVNSVSKCKRKLEEISCGLFHGEDVLHPWLFRHSKRSKILFYWTRERFFGYSWTFLSKKTWHQPKLD